ncbi:MULTISPECIES: nicotinate-nucleotide adenylyltransferase [Hyphobacterium]|uniref:Probable nicotinate-nucleotide adenylyltransferase n=1 Tax=Hyphobacterium vulgare TaxID=1736751 RepID=A0ABV6ZW02_9PROT
MRRSAPVRFGALTRRGRAAPPLHGEALAPGMRVGLFGGSFDPPHDGHLHAARVARRRLGLDRVWWLVSPQNPLKDRTAGDFLRRLEGVKSLASDPGMVVTDIEVRLGVRLTADVVAALVKRYPLVQFVWIMGADNLKSFHRWARWRDILRAVPVAVVARPQDPIRARLSLTARAFSHSRCNHTRAGALTARGAPGWTYLVEPLHKESSSRLRGEA